MVTYAELVKLKRVARKAQCVILMNFTLGDKLEIEASECEVPTDFSRAFYAGNNVYHLHDKDGNVEDVIVGNVDEISYTVSDNFDWFTVVMLPSKREYRHPHFIANLFRVIYYFVRDVDMSNFSMEAKLNKRVMENKLKSHIESLGIKLT